MHVRIRHGSIAAAALMVVGATAFAQPLVEDFEGLTQVTPDVLGTSSLPGVTSIFDDFGSAFSLPDAILGTDPPLTDFPYGNPGDDQFLRWTEATDQYIQYSWGSGALTGSGPVVQMAVALRVQLDPDVADNDIDVLFVSGTPLPPATGEYNLFGLVSVGGTNFRMATTNNFGGVTLSTTAFDPTAPTDPNPLATGTNWGDGKWRVLIGQVWPGNNVDNDLLTGTPRLGTAKWWLMDPETGNYVLLVDATDITNVRNGTDVDFLGFGASLDIGGASEDCILDMDHLSFYPISDPAYDTEAEFLAAVVADMANAAPAPINGDADNDGDVDVADATAVYNFAAGITGAPAGDGDVVAPFGTTNAADADAIVQFLVNGTPFPP